MKDFMGISWELILIVCLNLAIRGRYLLIWEVSANLTVRILNVNGLSFIIIFEVLQK